MSYTIYWWTLPILSSNYFKTNWISTMPADALDPCVCQGIGSIDIDTFILIGMNFKNLWCFRVRQRCKIFKSYFSDDLLLKLHFWISFLLMAAFACLLIMYWEGSTFRCHRFLWKSFHKHFRVPSWWFFFFFNKYILIDCLWWYTSIWSLNDLISLEMPK